MDLSSGVSFPFRFVIPPSVNKTKDVANFDFEKSALIFNIHSLTTVLGFDPRRSWPMPASISSQAFCGGEGFLSKSKGGNCMGQKYSQLAEDANEAVLVLGKLVDLLLKQEQAPPSQGVASSKNDRYN